MNAIHAKRLRKLADFLHTMPKEKFDFGTIGLQHGLPPLDALKAGHTRCGTVACAIGWMPAVFPRVCKWSAPTYFHRWLSVLSKKHKRVRDFALAERFFGLSADEALYLFQPDHEFEGQRGLSSAASPERVAQHIRRFVARKRKTA